LDKNVLTFIDLFAGAGGLSEGFVRAGFSPLAHIEMDKNASNTLKTRAAFHWLRSANKLDVYKQYLESKNERDDGRWLWEKVPKAIVDSVIQETIGDKTIKGLFEKVDALVGNNEVDVIVGGPPCQAYSLAGRARMGKRVENDPRNELYRYYVQFLQRYKPKMFVFENVKGLYSAKVKGEKPLEKLLTLIKANGYNVDLKLQKASDYGVLQNRERIIIVGWKSEIERRKTNFGYPILRKIQNNFCLGEDLFSDLPPRVAGEGSLTKPVPYIKSLKDVPYLKKFGIRNALDFTTQHKTRIVNENDRHIYKKAVSLWLDKKERLDYSKLPENYQKHKNKNAFLDRFKVVDPFGCSHTVVAHLSVDGHYFIYPTKDPKLKTVRSITIREAARIQSFPDDYFFEGCMGSAFKQIGNAVPVLLAECVANGIKKQITSFKKKRE